MNTNYVSDNGMIRHSELEEARLSLENDDTKTKAVS